jgi:hypothetical protein
MTWREYHELTKHTVESLRRSRHFLDWANMPNPSLGAKLGNTVIVHIDIVCTTLVTPGRLWPSVRDPSDAKPMR